MRLIQQFLGHVSSGRARRLLRRSAWPLLWCAVGLTVAGSAWIVITGLFARHELLAAQSSVKELQNSSGSSASAGSDRKSHLAATVRATAERAARAHFYTSGPAWYIAAHVPLIGDPLRTVRGAAEATDRLTAEVLSPLAHLAVGLTAGTDGSGHIDVTALRQAAPGLREAARAASDIGSLVEELPGSTWLPPVDRARTQLTRQLDRIVPASSDAATAARILPSMLGSGQSRRYLVIFQNSAEARGTGGLPGAFAVMAVDRGRLSFEDFGNDTALADARAKIDLGDEFTAAHGHNAPTRLWVNANLSPHFPYAARIWSDAFRRHEGKTVDGVIALDPTAISGLLAVTGPARLPDGTLVSSSNVVDLTERTSYAAYSDLAQRKAFFLDVARGVADHLLASADHDRMPPLLKALYGELREHRVMVWSRHPREQGALERHDFAGALPSSKAPFAGLVVNNAAGSKLDYYLERSLRWEPGQCGSDGRQVTVTVTLTNRAPRSGLPEYVTLRADDPPYKTRPGDNRLMVAYHATKGAVFTSASADGSPTMVSVTSERGHPVFTVDLELPAQSTRTVEFLLVEPLSSRMPVVWRQPLVTPMKATVLPFPPCDNAR